MNNENNVNVTQNPNVTNSNPGNVTTSTPAVQNNTVQTVVVPSNFPEETSVNTTNSVVSMPTIVNPLEVKVDKTKKEKRVVEQKKTDIDDEPKEKGPSEYALKLQQAIDNYKPPGKFKTALTILMFVFLILFAAFLPEISSYINYLKAGGEHPLPKEPTTGILKCVLETSTTNLDKAYTRKFNYEDNKLKSVTIETSTRGDITLDEEILDELYNKCVLIKNGLDDIEGVSLTCKYTEGLLVEIEKFTYPIYDVELVNAAYTEAGSTMLEFEYDSNIDDIKKSMLQAGFTCNKDVK